MATKIRGIALAAGVSANRRRYSAAMIEQAVISAQPLVRSGRMLMRAGHDAPDVAGIVGRVSALRYDAATESATFEGELADTAAGRDAQVLTAGKRPHVAVSIVGRWIGTPRHESVDGEQVETADGLDLLGVDLTERPGVAQARILGESRELAGLITESAPPAEIVDGADTAVPTRPMTDAELLDLSLRLLPGAVMNASPPRTSPFWASGQGAR